VSEVLGNIHETDWERVLQPRRCPNATCGCYIGYVHLPELRHEDYFGAGFFERVPTRPLANDGAMLRLHGLPEQAVS
jgi:hypothetical protein